MKQALFLIVALFQLMWPLSSRAESELETRANIQKDVSEAFLTRNFEIFERTAKEYRDSKARTTSGLWKLTLFYAGISTGIDRTTRKDPSRFELADNIVNEWTKKYPDSPTAWISQSIVLHAHGWAFRGGGYANTVPSDSWKPFFTYVGLAKDVLEKHKEVASIKLQDREHEVRYVSALSESSPA